MIDDVDRKIIDQLRINGRQSFREIGRLVGLSEPAVRARYARLTRAGVIQVVGMASPVRYGEIKVHLGIRIRGVPVAMVAEQLARVPEFQYIASCVGTFELICDVHCRDLTHLGELLTDRVRRVNGVEHAEALTVTEVLKDTYLWAGFRDAEPGIEERIIIPPPPTPDRPLSQGPSTNSP